MKEKKLEISIAIFIVLVVLIVIFAVTPLLGAIKGNSEEMIAQKNKFSNFENKLIKLEEFKLVKEELSSDFAKVDSLFINGDVPVAFIRFLESSAQEYSSDIEIISGGVQKSREDKWESVVFQLTTSGSFTNLSRFLKKLENSPYLINLQSLNISKSAEDSARASLSIKVFAK